MVMVTVEQAPCLVCGEPELSTLPHTVTGCEYRLYHGGGGGPVNLDRAVWAACAVQQFADMVLLGDVTEPAGTMLADLLADLMHWADRLHIDFDAAFNQATVAYVAEYWEEGSE